MPFVCNVGILPIIPIRRVAVRTRSNSEIMICTSPVAAIVLKRGFVKINLKKPIDQYQAYSDAFEKGNLTRVPAAIQFLRRTPVCCFYYFCFVPGHGPAGKYGLERIVLDDAVIHLR